MELKKFFCIDYLPFKVTPLYRLILKTRGTDSFFKSLNAEDSTNAIINIKELVL